MHESPGIIDESYLEYVKELVKWAARFGLYVIIDPHQDVKAPRFNFCDMSLEFCDLSK